ncbi:hypothetical protein FA014_01035 [Cellulomonas hominis]|uniref:HTH luxR-type domain-containing protein n=1 Tax=Cellulomonas hominis TaxID=156981 RepID=A0A7Z8NS03_9CELL|nr:LuxR C-terminal-related transcriptional regulator [Cellulomonas hominis]TKR27314.1 hypothetical protein FA014_01035 [Cellulomonas hominis]
MSAEGFSTTIAAVQRWLPLGRDVLIRGDRGAGKSTVLEALRANSSRGSAQRLLMRASGKEPLSAFRDHPSTPRGRTGENAWAEWLIDELGPRRGILLVDDIDRMDARSVEVVRRVLSHHPSLLVASSTLDPLRSPTDAMREVLLIRQPAEVRVQPFGLRAVADLLASRLGGPADTGLISSVLSQTGGNPRAAVALVDAARAADVVGRVDGLWIEEGSLDDVPVDAAVFLFLSTLPGELVGALELLSTVGPLPADAAARLVAPAVLAELTDLGRVVGRDLGESGEMLVVAPPVLARGLRERVAPYRRRQLAARVRAEAGSAVTPLHPATDDLTTVLMGDFAGDGDEYWRSTAELASLVHARATTEESARRAAWLTAPTLRAANAYLALLMRRPAAERLAEVFEGTRPDESDGAAERLTFAYYRFRWVAWAGASPSEVEQSLTLGGDDMHLLTHLRDLKERLLHELAAGRSADLVVDEEPVAVPARFLRGWPAVIRAAALLEAGHPEHATRVCAGEDGSGMDLEVRHYVAALRGQALLMSGRLPEAEGWQRQMLDAAYDELDALGIRVHACVLAEVLYFSGRGSAAWRVVSTALRIGAAGPIETTFYRRALTLGAVLQAQTGNVELARVLVRELDKSVRPYHPLIRSMRVLAHVAVRSASGGIADSGQLAWEAGERYAGDGLFQPALLAWIGGPAALTPARVEVVRAVLGRVHIPLLEPYVRLLLAVAEKDRSAAAGLLSQVHSGVAPGLVQAGRALVGGPTAREDGVSGIRQTAGARRDPLSPREREVAAIAREGLSNAEIADLLRISVRTVENHMSSLLRKLGYTSRVDLAGWQADDR